MSLAQALQNGGEDEGDTQVKKICSPPLSRLPQLVFVLATGGKFS